jgi:predicted cupin superfamily sugar epimerase
MTAPWVDALGLTPHPEGGWFRETWRAAPTFTPDGYGGPRHAATAILFALHPGEESRWHVVRSDELWFWHAGGPLTLRLGGARSSPAEAATVVLGIDLAAGQRPQVLIPGGAWQAAAPATARPVLVSCVVSPGFDYADLRMV